MKRFIFSIFLIGNLLYANSLSMQIAKTLLNPEQTAKQIMKNKKRKKNNDKEIKKFIENYPQYKKEFEKTLNKQIQSLLYLYPSSYFQPFKTTVSDFKKSFTKEIVRNYYLIKNNYNFYKKYLNRNFLFINKTINLNKFFIVKTINSQIKQTENIFKLIMIKKDIELFLKYYPEMVLNPQEYNLTFLPELKNIEKKYFNLLLNVEKIVLLNKLGNMKKQIYLKQIKKILIFLNRYPQCAEFNDYKTVLTSAYLLIQKKDDVRNLEKIVDEYEKILINPRCLARFYVYENILK